MMRRTIIIALLTTPNITCFNVVAQVRLPRILGDSMVLQRDVATKVWGYASKGEVVEVSLNQKKYKTVTGHDGKWTVTVPAMKAGGPHNIIIHASNHIELRDVMFGDVYVCSGQSNMEQPMSRVLDRYPEERAANNRYIRQFNITTIYNFKTAQEDLPAGKWATANPGSISQFYAIPYFFAKEIYLKYNVPIGIIQNAVGGSPAESWLSEDAIKEFPVHEAVANKYKNDALIDSIRKAEINKSNLWYQNIFEKDSGLIALPKWFNKNIDESGWKQMEVPGYWADNGLKTNGVVWFRKDFNLSGASAGKGAKLLLGNIVDRDSVYINGEFIGTTGYQYPPRKYQIRPGLLLEGNNNITVRIINSIGRGGFYKEKSYKLVIGTDSMPLEGTWKFKLGVASGSAPSSTTFHYLPVGLFNAMISPLLNLSIKGVLWYQGESNTGRVAEYHKLFPALIRNWRSKWKRDDLPFIYVQLANYMQAQSQPLESNWAALREAQTKSLSLPHTGMAVAIDLGEWNDIHPLNKKDVGIRLALAARHLIYKDKNIVYSGPLYKSHRVDGNKIFISFDHIGGGLVSKSGELKEFAIAGDDKVFRWAKAQIQGKNVVVWSDEIVNPVTVRYAWADNPANANLYNTAGLPAVPFRTDDDPGK